MSQHGNLEASCVDVTLLNANGSEALDETAPIQICRDELCECEELHVAGSGRCKMNRRPRRFSTRSKVFANEPWRAYCSSALRESVLCSVSAIEPRSFSTIISLVQNDYGTCCVRSVHRHLALLRDAGEIVRLDYKCRVYLRAGSRLLVEEDLDRATHRTMHSIVDQIWDRQAPSIPSLQEIAEVESVFGVA
jgi:hypothetical protein